MMGTSLYSMATWDEPSFRTARGEALDEKKRDELEKEFQSVTWFVRADFDDVSPEWTIMMVNRIVGVLGAKTVTLDSDPEGGHAWKYDGKLSDDAKKAAELVLDAAEGVTVAALEENLSDFVTEIVDAEFE